MKQWQLSKEVVNYQPLKKRKLELWYVNIKLQYSIVYLNVWMVIGMLNLLNYDARPRTVGHMTESQLDET